MSEQHDRFLARLRSSGPAVFAVAEWFWRRGYSVTIPALRYAPDASQYEDYVDTGDLIATKSWADPRMIEVKNVKRSFSVPSTWPFDDIFISNVGTVERADPPAYAYFIVSKDLTHAAIIMGDTKHTWYKKKERAGNTGNIEEFYVAPLSEAKFIKLGDM